MQILIPALGSAMLSGFRQLYAPVALLSSGVNIFNAIAYIVLSCAASIKGKQFANNIIYLSILIF